MRDTAGLGARVRLRDGLSIPQLGLGIYKTPDAAVPDLVVAAAEAGYRHFDTAAMYDNEGGLGRGLRATGRARDEFFVTTKVLNADHGYTSTLAACRQSLKLLNTEYVDLYLIHWPAPKQDRYLETWRALETLRADGLVRSIGVSNFHQHHIERLKEISDTVPVINQVECHPWLPQRELIAYHQRAGIVTQAWSPLARGRVLDDPTLHELAHELGRTPAQVVLRWHLQRGTVVIPKSVKAHRIRENANIFDFVLLPDHMAQLSQLETGVRTGMDPDERD